MKTTTMIAVALFCSITVTAAAESDIPQYVPTKPAAASVTKAEYLLELNGLQSRRQLDIIGLIMAYGITIAGDLAVDDELLAGTVVPIIGPFLAIGDSNASGYEAALIASGVIQTFFAIDAMRTSKKINATKSAGYISIQPMTKGVGLIASIKY